MVPNRVQSSIVILYCRLLSCCLVPSLYQLEERPKDTMVQNSAPLTSTINLQFTVSHMSKLVKIMKLTSPPLIMWQGSWWLLSEQLWSCRGKEWRCYSRRIFCQLTWWQASKSCVHRNPGWRLRCWGYLWGRGSVSTTSRSWIYTLGQAGLSWWLVHLSFVVWDHYKI